MNGTTSLWTAFNVGLHICLFDKLWFVTAYCLTSLLFDTESLVLDHVTKCPAPRIKIAYNYMKWREFLFLHANYWNWVVVSIILAQAYSDRWNFQTFATSTYFEILRNKISWWRPILLTLWSTERPWEREREREQF